jgi:hypothetical protein
MRWSEAIDGIGFKIIHLDCVIGRRGMTRQLTSSVREKLIILKPIVRPAVFLTIVLIDKSTDSV